MTRGSHLSSMDTYPGPDRLPGATVLACLAVLGLFCWGAPASAQEPAPADSLFTTGNDSTYVDPSTGEFNQDSGLGPGLSAAEMAAAQSANSQSVSVDRQGPQSFYVGLKNSIKGGIKSDVRVNKYYGNLESTLSMFGSSSFKNSFSYSWDDFRQQNKTIETRGYQGSYTAGNLLPFNFSASGTWDWSEDNTVNNAGFANLSKRDIKRGSMRASKSKFDVGPLKTLLNAAFGTNDQKSVNKGQANNFDESYLNGGIQVGGAISPGLAVAVRGYGRTVSGSRTLGENSAPSSATNDSMGAGVYFDQGFTTGRLSVTRSNADKKYLDYIRNSTGQIDTVGLDEFDKVVDELESKDALSLEFFNEWRIDRLGIEIDFNHDFNDLAYTQSGVGSKDRLNDQANFAVTYGTRRDSFAVAYGYLWKWDDQRIKNATANRGRQYTKNRDLDFFYGRRLFTNTNFSCKLHTGLGQDIAQNEFNNNDKDRLRNDLVLEMNRNWPGKFKAKLLFAYKQNQDISIRSTRSSNNNIKDSYEVSPGYSWPISDWLSLNQSYRVYIQYTDYIYSYLDDVNKEDNYNKRGNLNTIVVIKPTGRLDLAIRHDFNKRSNATRSVTDATGNTFYRTDQKQKINKIDLGAVFRVAPGVTLEGATFRTRDWKEIYGTTTRETEVYSGEIWVGAKVNQTWGTKNPLELSLMVKKYNAFGPSVTEASSDYWEADAWLRWEF